MTNITDAADEQEPLFETLEQMCLVLGWSDAVCEQIARDMEATAPGIAPTLH